jgi:hypothetical protein
MFNLRRIALACVRVAAGLCSHKGPLLSDHHLTCQRCRGIVCPECSHVFCGGEGRARKVKIAIHTNSYGQCLCK